MGNKKHSAHIVSARNKKKSNHKHNKCKHEKNEENNVTNSPKSGKINIEKNICDKRQETIDKFRKIRDELNESAKRKHQSSITEYDTSTDYD